MTHSEWIRVVAYMSLAWERRGPSDEAIALAYLELQHEDGVAVQDAVRAIARAGGEWPPNFGQILQRIRADERERYQLSAGERTRRMLEAPDALPVPESAARALELAQKLADKLSA